ncbi:A/G-specific adenine glycosylase [Deinococcus sp. KSM4-11]|uniref:A/G-specific adenine glycosylase n=1 Tax=Deinococcus sp. KSM4-11 TaxID=2568654 RepID=UPI0010A4CEB8|nr:NUDIX domain-containing protein [Deinococcus sp. KSM4-11]THF86444.1 A/G-specific adenine glycosylase [Deinococcus sp. KSM4-11]
MIVLPPSEVPTLRAALLTWFDARGRELPWRQGVEGRRDPYRVWIAEILLQQTQVVRGRVYYDRFLTAFPDVHALAAAPEAAVLKAWEGCGYYARARNLRRAAQLVAAQGFPETYVGWLALPGVGPYTAAAIASLAYGGARAVNDGNVRRVLARLYGEAVPTEPWVQARADALLDPVRPGAWNEAVMDLGATVCTPRSPRCGACPLALWCAARASGQPDAFPAPKVRAAVQDVQAVAVLIGDEKDAVLEERAGTLLGGLMGLPTDALADGGDAVAVLTRLCARLQARPGPLLGQVTHTMTHRRVTLYVYRAHSAAERTSVAQAALSRLDQKALALGRARQDSLFAEEVE